MTPLRLTDMRAEGVHSVSVDCSCGASPDVNVDHLPGDMAVPDVRKHVRCVCGKVPVRVIPNWVERTGVVGIPDTKRRG